MNLTHAVSAHRTATASRALAVGLPRGGRLVSVVVGGGESLLPSDPHNVRQVAPIPLAAEGLPCPAATLPAGLGEAS